MTRLSISSFHQVLILTYPCILSLQCQHAAKPDENEDIVNQDIQEMEKADWQLYSHLHPNADLPTFSFNDLE